MVSSPFFTYQYYWLPIIPFSDFNMFFNMLKRHGTPPAGTPRCGFFVPCSGWDCDRAPFAVLWSPCRQPENGNVTNGTALRIAGHLEKKTQKTPSSNTAWWFHPLWKILVSWDDYSQYMQICKNKKCLKPPTSYPVTKNCILEIWPPRTLKRVAGGFSGHFWISSGYIERT